MIEIATPFVHTDDRRARRNAVVLALASALAGAPAGINIAAASLAAYAMLGEDKTWSTTPITAFVVGTACGTVPAALLMRRIGRRAGLMIGMGIGATGALLEAAAIAAGLFVMLNIGAFLLGFAGAFTQQFRFAVADTASPSFRPRAIAWVMLGGVVAAVIGPQTVIHTADLIQSAPYAGAFLGSAALSLLAAVVLIFVDIPRPAARTTGNTGRPIGEIARQPKFLVAVGCAASSFAIMSFVMTAAPLAMVMHHHHRDAAVLGIQWHAVAMYLPSFVTGSLITRFGAPRIVALGLLLLIACALVGLSGTEVAHFWLALVLLGIGWNFGFVGGTALVTETYAPEEKEKVQALNDFVIFGVVAVASLSSGEALLLGGWSVLNLIVLPVALIVLAILTWEIRRERRSR